MNTKFGTAKIDNKGYYCITTRKEGNHRKFLHRLIYEDLYGPIPESCVIHHKDGNPRNNCIANLQIMSRFEHRSHHSQQYHGENNPMYGKHHSDETRKKISEANFGKKNRFDPCITIRQKPNNTYKQGYTWRATPSTKNKQITISSTNLQKCIQKVKEFIKSESNTFGYTSYRVVVT